MKRIFPLLFLVILASLFLCAYAPPCLKKEITISIAGEEEQKAEISIEVTHALRAKRAGGYEALYERLLQKYDAKSALNYLGVRLGDYLSAECEERKVDPLNATLEWNKDLSSPFIYYPERSGKAIDLVDAGRAVARAMDIDTGAYARLCAREVPAEVTERDLRAQTAEMGRFTTDFQTSGENRRHNLSLAATLISGSVIGAGESFSFNGTVGARTAERGFREANIVVNGEFIKGIGGGVCQVSTTLYNAVLLAGLPVENAAAHSRPVSYVPYSRDCTVSSAIDFRFRNDTAYPVYLAAAIKGDRLTFVLYGAQKEGTRKLESEVVEELPYQNLFENGERVEDTQSATLLCEGRTGVRSRLYLTTEYKGKRKRELIRENVYPPKNAIYKK